MYAFILSIIALWALALKYVLLLWVLPQKSCITDIQTTLGWTIWLVKHPHFVARWKVKYIVLFVVLMVCKNWSTQKLLKKTFKQCTFLCVLWNDDICFPYHNKYGRGKKSCILETKHLSNNADISTDTTVAWTKNTQKPNYF